MDMGGVGWSVPHAWEPLWKSTELGMERELGGPGNHAAGPPPGLPSR